MLQATHETQSKAKESLERTRKTAREAKDIGIDVAQRLDEDNDRLKLISEEVAGIETGKLGGVQGWNCVFTPYGLLFLT